MQHHSFVGNLKFVNWSLLSCFFQMLTNNRIWKQRTVDVGVVSVEDALNYGFRLMAILFNVFFQYLFLRVYLFISYFFFSLK